MSVLIFHLEVVCRCVGKPSLRGGGEKFWLGKNLFVVETVDFDTPLMNFNPNHIG